MKCIPSRKGVVMVSLFGIFMCMQSIGIHAQEEKLGGCLKAEDNGEALYFPVLKTDIQSQIKGDIASVRVIQTFINPSRTPMNATYLFPLNQYASVYAMKMEVGDEVITANIKRVEEANRIFEQAKQEGRAASLLEQHRPNMFTQKLANLMPDLPIKVTLEYVQIVPKKDGQYEMVLPLVVGPRYQPKGSGEAPQVLDDLDPEGRVINQSKNSRETFGQWELEELPEYPVVMGLTIPDTIDANRVTIEIELDGGMPVQQVYSPTHDLDISPILENKKRITLKPDKTIDNKDFEFHYLLASNDNQFGLHTHKDERGGFFSLLIEPPANPLPDQISSREMVFVLDTSGSMSGMPVQACKTFMKHALQNLRQKDYFRIIRFSNQATEFTNRPMPATPANIQKGISHVNNMHGGGGTEMKTGVIQALDVKQQPNTIRIVVFLTDGYIGNESEILGLISSKINDARLYAFGVGTSVNRYLLDEMGIMGRGFTKYIDPTETPEEAAQQLAHQLDAPVLTDIHIDWGDLSVYDDSPNPIPDLFAGQSIRVQGRYDDGTQTVIQLNGRVNGKKASMKVPYDFPDSTTTNDSSSIALIWAKSKIQDLMRKFHTPQHMHNSAFNKDHFKREIVQIGLDFSLITQWTSFVAKSEKIVNNNPQDNIDTGVPLPQVKGVSPKAYPSAPQVVQQPQRKSNPSRNSFSGAGTPEPATIGGLLLTLTAAFYTLRKKIYK